MDPLGLAKFPALVTLGNRATFLLDLEEGPVVVIAGRRAMAFDARLAVFGKESGIMSVGKKLRKKFCNSVSTDHAYFLELTNTCTTTSC